MIEIKKLIKFIIHFW